MITEEELAKVIDHTNLYPDSTRKDLERLCDEAKEYELGAVCVYSGDVSLVSDYLGKIGYDAKVCSVAGFPSGRQETKVKVNEAEVAVAGGGDEIDVVINQRYIQDGEHEKAVSDLEKVREATGNRTLKVIAENCNLDREEKIMAYRAAEEAGADFIKTSTGFGDHGAKVRDVELMRKRLEKMNSEMGIKASGGIGIAAKAFQMLVASEMELDPEVFRIGASSGDEIIESL